MGLIMKKTRAEIFETMQRVFKKKDSETCIHYEPVKMKYEWFEKYDPKTNTVEARRKVYIFKDPRPGEEVGEGWVNFDECLTEDGETKSEEAKTDKGRTVTNDV